MSIKVTIEASDYSGLRSALEEEFDALGDKGLRGSGEYRIEKYYTEGVLAGCSSPNNFSHDPSKDWTENYSGCCPVHPMDVVECRQKYEGNLIGEMRFVAKDVKDWTLVDAYRHVRDEDGVPYCSNEGLEDWAEYVATDVDGGCHQYEGDIDRDYEEWSGDRYKTAPGRYINTQDHWANTLRRVWRGNE